MRATVALGLVAIVVGLPGCEGECYDCGPCGYVGGPNEVDWLGWAVPGIDETGRVAVPLVVARSGECASFNGSLFHLVWGGATWELEPQDPETAVDTSGTDYDGGDTYSLADHGVSIAIERDPVNRGQLIVRFIQDDPPATATASCALDAPVDATLSCDELQG